MNVEIQRLTNGPKHHLFGFHDLLITNHAGDKLLSLEVDTINRLYRHREATAGSRALLRAICEAGKRRLKPIVMTSLTTILAILPLLRRGDMGSALQFPLSLTLVIGMVGGTLVSLYLVPVLYHLLYRKRS